MFHCHLMMQLNRPAPFLCVCRCEAAARHNKRALLTSWKRRQRCVLASLILSSLVCNHHNGWEHYKLHIRGNTSCTTEALHAAHKGHYNLHYWSTTICTTEALHAAHKGHYNLHYWGTTICTTEALHAAH